MKGKIAGTLLFNPPGTFSTAETRAPSPDAWCAKGDELCTSDDAMPGVATPVIETEFILDSSALIAALHSFCHRLDSCDSATFSEEDAQPEISFDVLHGGIRAEKPAEEGKVEEKPLGSHDDHYLHAQNQEDHTMTHEGTSKQPCSASGTCKTDLARELRELNDRLIALSHADPDDESAECMFNQVLDRYNWIEDHLACVDDEGASSAKIAPADSPSPSLDIDRAAAIPIPDSDGEQLESRQVAKPCTGDEASRTVDPCKAPAGRFSEVSLAPIAVFLVMVKSARLHVPHIACTVRETFWIYSRIPLAIWDTDSVFYGLRRGSPVRLIGMIGAPHYNGLKGFIQAKAISKLNGLRNVRVHFPEFPRPFGNEWMNLPAANVEPY